MRRVVREPFPDPMVRDAIAFGQAIRAARTAASISLETAAEALGISKATMSDLESGRGTVALGTALRAAQDLGVACFATPLASQLEASRALQDVRSGNPEPWGGIGAKRTPAASRRLTGTAG